MKEKCTPRDDKSGGSSLPQEEVRSQETDEEIIRRLRREEPTFVTLAIVIPESLQGFRDEICEGVTRVVREKIIELARRNGKSQEQK